MGDTVTCTGDLNAGFSVGAAITDVTVILESGSTITTATEDGLSVNESSRIENRGAITIDGTERSALRAEGGSTVDNTATGSIVLNADNARGIFIPDTPPSAPFVITNDGSITGSATGLRGIEAEISGAVTHRGTIDLTGNGAIGISSDGVGSTIDSNGAITLDGDQVVGIEVGASGRATNTSTIQITGTSSEGISAATGTGGVRTTVENAATGSIILDGGTQTGILTENTANVTNDGSITGTGFALSGVRTGTNASVTNRGTIDLTGGESRGISMVGGSTVNTGSVTVAGAEGRGITTGAFSRVQNSGDVTVFGANAVGLETTGDRTDLGNFGAISVGGDGSAGMSSSANGFNENQPNFLVNGADGQIVSNGPNGFGIRGEAFARIENDGTVTMQGQGATALSTGDTSSIQNRGTVLIQAVDSVAVDVGGFAGTSTPSFRSFLNTVNPTTGQGGVVLSSNPDAGPLVRIRAGAPNAITVIENAAGATLEADLTNLGTPGRAIAIEGSIGRDQVINAGTIQGLVDLGAGNDIFEQTATSEIVDIGMGSVDGGLGEDEIRLSASGSGVGRFTFGTTFQNFELVGVSGLWSVQGAGPAGLDLAVRPGGTVRLDGPVTVDGDFTVDAPGAGEPVGTVQAFLSGATVGAPEILHATGDIDVENGNLEVVVGPGFVGSQTFTILRADGTFGNPFAGLILPNDPDLAFGAPVYEGGALSIAAWAAPYSMNQNSVAGYLGLAEAAGASPELQSVIDGLNLLDYRSFRNALDQLHPEVYDAHTTTNLELANRFTNLLLERPDYCIAGPEERSVDPRTRATCRQRKFEPWVSLYGQLGNRDGESGHISWNDKGAGIAVGLDHRINETFMVSGSLGTAYDTLEVDGIGRGRFTTFDVGLQAGYTDGPIRAQAALTYGHGWQSQFRNIAVPGFARTSKGEWQTNRVGTRFQGEYAFDWGGARIAPVASIDYTALLQEAFREAGARPVSLAVDARTDHVVTVRAGFELGSSFSKSDYWTEILEATDGVWRPSLSVKWRQIVTGADRDYTASFIGDPTGNTLTVWADVPDRGFEIGGGIDWTPKAANRLTFGLRYDVFVWTGVTSHDLVGRVRLSF